MDEFTKAMEDARAIVTTAVNARGESVQKQLTENLAFAMVGMVALVCAVRVIAKRLPDRDGARKELKRILESRPQSFVGAREQNTPDLMALISRLFE